MSMQPAEYTWISRTHVTRWDSARQQAVDGVECIVRWNRTGTVLPVFVPDQEYNPTNVDVLIRQAGYRDDDMNALGGSGG